jgi:hypothetical protein
MTPLERQTPPRFVVGRDADGFWAAMSADGREGGLFASRDEALKFARHAGAAVRRARGPVNLWIAKSRRASAGPSGG